ncbi:MAG: hypothetical protein MHM6MM_004933 [Cercozoa sp. M6MM]
MQQKSTWEQLPRPLRSVGLGAGMGFALGSTMGLFTESYYLFQEWRLQQVPAQEIARLPAQDKKMVEQIVAKWHRENVLIKAVRFSKRSAGWGGACAALLGVGFGLSALK